MSLEVVTAFLRFKTAPFLAVLQLQQLTSTEAGSSVKLDPGARQLPWDDIGWDTIDPQTEVGSHERVGSRFGSRFGAARLSDPPCPHGLVAPSLMQVVAAAHWGPRTRECHEEIIRRAPNLKWLHTLSTGVNHLPLDQLARAGVVVAVGETVILLTSPLHPY